MTDNSHMEVYHKTTRVCEGGGGLISEVFSTIGILLILGALIGLVFMPLIALVSGALGCMFYGVSRVLGPKYRVIDYCDACGNEFSPTTRVCPHCHAKILTPPPAWTLNAMLLVALGVIVSVLVALAIITGR